MALQIANPVVVGKVERLAKATGLSKTAVVERALDCLMSETTGKSDGGRRLAALSIVGATETSLECLSRYGIATVIRNLVENALHHTPVAARSGPPSPPEAGT